MIACNAPPFFGEFQGSIAAYIYFMGIHDRDWYRHDHKQKAAKDALGRSSDNSPVHASAPPEPHQWPAWAIVLIWMFIAVFAAVIADRFNSNTKAMAKLERQLMSLKDCDYVASGPCMKLAPHVRK